MRKQILAPETIEKIRVAKLGKHRPPFSAEWIEKIRLAGIGRKHSAETKEKMRLSAIKRSSPAYREKQKIAHLGQKHTEETKRKLSLMRKGRLCPWKEGPCPLSIRGKISDTLKNKFKDPTFKEKAIRAIMRNRPWLPAPDEKKIIALCKKRGLPFEYVGDGKLIIAGKIPDFIDSKNKKLLIEVYGKPSGSYEVKRAAIFGPLGFKILFLSKRDLENKNWEVICSQKIKVFMGG